MASMNETWRLSFSIYWKAMLAGLVLAVLSGAVIGFFISFISIMLGNPPGTAHTLIQWVSGLAGLGISFVAFNFFVARAIGKTIGNKTLHLESVPSYGEGQ